MATEDEICTAATRFRSALDAIAPATWAKATVTNFPRGACGHASELLGRFLRETIGIEPEVVVQDFLQV